MEQIRRPERLQRSRSNGKRLPKILLPPYQPPAPEELKRRRQAVDEIRRIRDAIGPIGRSVVDLIREDRESR